MKKKSRNTFFFLLLILHHIIALPMSLRRVIHPEYAWILHLCFSLSLHSLAPVCARFFFLTSIIWRVTSRAACAEELFLRGVGESKSESENTKSMVYYIFCVNVKERKSSAVLRPNVHTPTVSSSAISSGDERVKVKAYIRDRERGGQQRARASTQFLIDENTTQHTNRRESTFFFNEMAKDPEKRRARRRTRVWYCTMKIKIKNWAHFSLLCCVWADNAATWHDGEAFNCTYCIWITQRLFAQCRDWLEHSCEWEFHSRPLRCIMWSVWCASDRAELHQVQPKHHNFISASHRMLQLFFHPCDPLYFLLSSLLLLSRASSSLWFLFFLFLSDVSLSDIKTRARCAS